MTPPINIDGESGYGSVTIDGQTVKQITIDGQNVLAIIPDSGDLHARYDFTQEDGTTPVADQTGNGFDLGNGAYSGVGVSINGNQAGEFDGTNDRVHTSFTTVSQPTTIALAFDLNQVPQGGSRPAADEIFDADTGTQHIVRAEGDGPFWNIFTGTDLDDGSATTGQHIIVATFNGASSELRADGVSTTGDAGSGALDGVNLGSRGDGSNNADVNIGEVLVYPSDKSGIAGDIESYLSLKWGISI